MEVNVTKPNTEASNLISSAVQVNRFNERQAREAQSDVKNQAVYFSPVIKIDSKTNSAILQYRDPTTGDVTNEYPTPKKVDRYSKAQKLSDDAVTTAPAKKDAVADDHHDDGADHDSIASAHASA